MPLLFLVALAGSLAVHATALFGPEVDLTAPPAPLVLNAELKALPAAPRELPEAAPAKPVAKARQARPAVSAGAVAPSPVMPALAAVAEMPDGVEIAAAEPSTAPVAPAPAPPAKPLLPASGVIRYTVIKSSLNMAVGQVEQRWEFAADGSYRLRSVTETTGIAALLKPVRVEQESRGRLVAGGLQPEHFSTMKNGRDANENAEFDWSTGEVRLSREAGAQAVTRGTQDALSLNYQLAYLGRLTEGTTLGVVTGKKYDRYALDSLGEEELDVPAGRFRTLHLRAQTDSTTEIWIALDQRGLPVKIRFTDKKGESFEQVATEIGM